MRSLSKGVFVREIMKSGASVGLALAAGLALAGCEENGRLPSNSRHYVALSPQIQNMMAEKGMNARQPILLRAYKKESELEVWKLANSGQYELLKTFPMCRWSGQLGPKRNEGDRQVPEGFYAITQNQLNPHSNFYLSFNVGYPNAYDRAHGRSGSLIMVHGACSSRGCFSMTDEQIADIYALMREAFGGGQKAVQLQSLPFRMSAENLAKYRADEHMPFWKNLKEGADAFEVSRREPEVAVCGRRYVFNAQGKDGARLDATSACPPLARDESLVAAIEEKGRHDERAVASLVAAGVKPVKRVYQDGDQHPSFQRTIYALNHSSDPTRAAVPPARGESKIAEVSQPDALAIGAVELPHDQTRGLSRQALLAKAARHANGAPEPTTTASVTPAKRGTGPAVASAAPPATTATALVATEKKSEPAFYRRWMSSLGTLTASAKDIEAAKPVDAPLPPKAPRR